MKTGFAFGEHIRTEKIRKRNYDHDDPQFRMRSGMLLLALLVAGLFLTGKLFYLQIMNGNSYQEKADINRTRTQIIHAPRGIIFDRNGAPLTINIPGFRRVIKQDGDKKSRTEVLNKEKALELIAKGDKNIEVASLRQYPFKEALTHVLGYIGQISKEELEASKNNYNTNDWIGKNGIEKVYENLLRGNDGRRLIEVDAMGKQIRLLGQDDPIPGKDITLTIDAKLQQAAYKAARGISKGAVIVSKPDGEILALVSKPSFDANFFTLDNTYKTSSDSSYFSLEEILTDNENQPLMNRPIAGIYPPGSTFKIITAVSGLENKIIDQNYTVEDTGILKIGDFSFANWFYTSYGKTEGGRLDVRRALSRSNDIFFYKLAEKIGAGKLSDTARKFGLGDKLGIDLDGESKGLVPSKEWKKEAFNENWYLGDTYHYGIGQGYLLTTPLQVNVWTQVVANGGTLYQPRLIKDQDSKIKDQNLISEKTGNLIREGMVQSCSKGGVAYPLFDFKVQNSKLKIDGRNYVKTSSTSAAGKKKDFVGIPVACKTGTSQHGGEEIKPHAWITLFAPAYDPQVVVTVLSESSGEGSVVAAPVAKKILEAYFQ